MGLVTRIPAARAMAKAASQEPGQDCREVRRTALGRQIEGRSECGAERRSMRNRQRAHMAVGNVDVPDALVSGVEQEAPRRAVCHQKAVMFRA